MKCFLFAVAAAAAAAVHAQAPGASAALAVPAPEFLAACRASIAEARQGMAKLKELHAPGALQALAAYDSSVKVLNDAGAKAGLAQNTHPDAALRAAAETCGRETSAASTEFSLDRGVFDVLSRAAPAGLDEASRYYLSRTLQRFRLAGVDRDEATRARIKALSDELTKLSQAFNRNIRDSVLKLQVDPKDLDGLPPDFVQAHRPGADGKVTLTTDNSDFSPVMSYARSPGLRETYWKLYRQRAHPANLPVLDQMLAKRYELAQLLGFANWADYVTADKMIGSGRAAGDFIEKISRAADARMKRDYAQLLARKKKDEPAATELLPWDTSYLSDRIKAEQYGVESQEVRPYFQYDAVKKAVLDTASKLFAIRFAPVPDAPVWHPTVEVYDVFEGERRLGRIYLDMHPRDNKYKHAAHFRFAYGKRGVSLPESVLVCNLRQPTADDPGLLEYSDVRTFFHEFGHLVHAILGGHTQWAGTSGVATERDFVEAPSQLLEEWMRDPKTLRSFALHYQTKQPIPVELTEKLKRAEEVGKGLFVRGQMSLAAISLGLHDRDPRGPDTTAFTAQMTERYTAFKAVPGTYLQEAFNHLDNYSAIYYTYMWSLVIAKDMASAFKAQGDLMNPAMALKYRRAVLEQGGSKPAGELVRDFLGRPYSFKAYEDWLNSD